MAKQKLDSYTELNALLQEREAKKKEALGKLYKAKTEAEEKLAAAMPKKKDALDDFDVDEFINGSQELSYLPGYIRELDQKINELQRKPFGAPFDTFMGKVAEISGETNSSFEKEFTELVNTLFKLCRENIEFTSQLNDLEHRWLCNPMASYSNRSALVSRANEFFELLRDRNFKIEGYEPFI